MNLVEHIKDQLSSESAGKLGALIGEGEGRTRAVLSAAVPALLAALANLAGSSEGADKLAAALGKFEPDLFARLKDKTTGEAQAVLDEGQAALGQLFGPATRTALTETLTKNTGLAEEKVQKLIGYLAALVLGCLTGLLKGQPATAGAVTGLFADQQQNLANAVPANVSLERVPGLGKTVESGENGAFVNVVVALVFLVVLVAAGWFILKPGGILSPSDRPAATAKK